MTRIVPKYTLPPRKKDNTHLLSNWKNLLLSGGILTLMGSVIGFVLQLTSVTLPLYMGDHSDFAINIEPPGIAIDRAVEKGPLTKTVNVSVLDFHPRINSYKHDVFFLPMNHSKYIDITFDPPVVRAGGKSSMILYISPDCYGTHYIQVQGIGGNGKKRNSTFVLRIYRHVSYM